MSMVELKNIPEININSRVQVNNFFGTVKYVGEVKDQKGIWVGVEWDDSNRGKHNGTVQGTQYFQCRHSTSGSMIRIEKVPNFVSLEESIRSRYFIASGEIVIDQKLIRDFQKNSHAPLFEVVGIEKLADKQSHLDELEDISVAHCNVNRAGNLNDFKNLIVLDISSTLVWNWHIVADITKAIPSLRSLNLANNRLVLPSQNEISNLEPSFRHIKNINLRNCDLKLWENVLLIAQLWLNIEYITLQDNNIETIPPKDYIKIFNKLEHLDLQKNKLNDFSNFVNLGNIPNLKILNALNNDIKIVELPQCSHDEKLNIFKNLDTLYLAENPLVDDVHTFNELDKLPALKSIIQTPNRESGYEKMFVKAAALIRTLEVVNKSVIEKKDKRHAEYDIWKLYGEEWLEAEKDPEKKHKFLLKCRVYDNLVEKYGSPADFICHPDAKKSNMITVKIVNECTDETIEKKLPLRMSIQILFNLIQKLFHIDYNEMESQKVKIFYVDKNNRRTHLDSLRKNLDYYSILDGDKILIEQGNM